MIPGWSQLMLNSVQRRHRETWQDNNDSKGEESPSRAGGMGGG